MDEYEDMVDSWEESAGGPKPFENVGDAAFLPGRPYAFLKSGEPSPPSADVQMKIPALHVLFSRMGHGHAEIINAND